MIAKMTPNVQMIELALIRMKSQEDNFAKSHVKGKFIFKIKFISITLILLF